jgi:hypothetical protein
VAGGFLVDDPLAGDGFADGDCGAGSFDVDVGPANVRKIDRQVPLQLLPPDGMLKRADSQVIILGKGQNIVLVEPFPAADFNEPDE